MVVREPFRIDQLPAEFNETLLKAFRLRDPAERGDLFPFEQIEAAMVARENIFEIKRLMNAFDNPRGGVERSDAATQLSGFTIALRDKDGGGAGEMTGRFAQ